LPHVPAAGCGLHVPPRARDYTTHPRSSGRATARTYPHSWSFAAHNLAEALVYPGASATEVREALSLYRDALALRPLDAVPELHCESAHQLGALLGGRRYPGQLPTLREVGVSPEDAYREAREALRSALTAGRALGIGRNLVTAARTMGLVAAEPPGHLTCDVASAHEALEALAEVLALAPEDARAADAEAEVARALVIALAKLRAAGAPRVDDRAVLDGAAAWELVHLVLRARGGGHRRLRVRLSRPDGVDPERWTRWRRVLHEQNNFEERRQVAAEIQRQAPDFLTASPSLSRLLGWLQPGRAAASIVMTDAAMVLVVLWNGDTGPSARAVVADLSRCPVPEASLRELFVSAVDRRRPDHASAVAKAADLHAWLVGTIVEALKVVLPACTTELCWSPNGIAVWVPLTVLWSAGPRIWTTPCITHPPPQGGAMHGLGALLVCADPRAAGHAEALADAPGFVAQLADSLASTTGAVVLAGAGRAYGHSLLSSVRPDVVVDRPPSPEEVLARAQGRHLVLILAHGAYDPDEPARSAFVLVDGNGAERLLTAQAISEHPALLRDTVVVLLSCESGASGRLDAGPAGLAGALLSVGAKVVIAPLWVVSLGTAIRVGRAIVDHLACHRPVDSLPDAVSSARLDLDATEGRDDILHGPFVVWCG
jgi:tetratricopeptide (TPR) repeat protein